MKSLKTPRGLGSAGVELFTGIAQEFAIKDREGAVLLQLAAEALTDYEIYRRAVLKDGATSRGRDGQLKPHPCISAARDARSQVVACLKALGLEGAEVERRLPGRPSRHEQRVNGEEALP